MSATNTAEELRAHAAEHELYEVNFLDKKGRIAGKFRATATAEFHFVDGSLFVLPKAELDLIDDIQFSLRPSRTN